MRPAATVLALAPVLAGCGDGETGAADTGEELTGCNRLFGEIDVRRDRLDMSSMGGTETACDDASILRLTHPRGHGLVLRAGA